MRVVVTGGSGFIGGHMVDHLTNMGHEVTNLDRKEGHDLDRLPSAVKLITDCRPELILHFASSVSTPGSVSKPLATFRDTVITAAAALEAARYGKTPILITSSVKARDGMTPYGASKRMVEAWAQEYRSAYGVPVLINRPGTVYGPGQEGSLESGWIAWFLMAKASGVSVTINGDGKQVRDLLHVDDYVQLMGVQISDFFLGVSDWDGSIWDVGGGMRNTTTVLSMAQYLGLGYSFGEPRYGDAHTYVGVNDYPGWEPEIYWKDSDVFAR